MILTAQSSQVLLGASFFFFYDLFVYEREREGVPGGGAEG